VEQDSEDAVVGALSLLAREHALYTFFLAVRASLDAPPGGGGSGGGVGLTLDVDGAARRQWAHWRAGEHPFARAPPPSPPPLPAEALAAASQDATWNSALAALRGGAPLLPPPQPPAPRVPAWPLLLPYVATTLEGWHRAQPASEKPRRALEQLMEGRHTPALWWWEASRCAL
jgi:hypothetical protein